MRGFNQQAVDPSVCRSPGRLRLRNGTTYQITCDDVTWIAKLVWGEAMDGDPVHAASVIWTVSQRADLFWPSVRSNYGGQLGQFFRAFSSPIRPTNPTNPRIMNAAWNDIPVYARTMAIAYATGALPNPIPGSVDFANRQLPRTGMQLLARIGYRGPTTGNNFYARRVGDAWTSAWDWTSHEVVGAAGTSLLTREALSTYGAQAQDGATSLFGGLFPGGDRVLGTLSGRR